MESLASIDSDQRSQRLALLGAALVIVLGCLVRLDGLWIKSLWIDELVTFDVAQRALLSPLSNQGSLMGFALSDAGPGPLAYLTEWMMLHLWPEERLLRIPSAIFSCMTLPMMWLVLRRLVAGNPARVIGLLLWALCLPQVAFAQEARGYALATLLCLGGLWAFVRLWQGEGWRWWWIGIALHLAGFFTSYFAALSLGALILASLGMMRRRSLAETRPWAVAGHILGGMALFIVPTLLWLRALLPRAFHQDFGVGSTESALRLWPSSEGWREFGGLWLRWTREMVREHALDQPGWLLVLHVTLASAIWLGMPLLGMACRGWRRPWPLLWIGLAAGPLAFVTVLSTSHFLSPRYLFFCHAPLIALAAWGVDCLLSRFTRPRLRLTVTSLLVALSLLVGLPRILSLRAMEKANWREAAALLARETVPGDIVIAGPNSDAVCLYYYLQRGETGSQSHRWEFIDFSHPQMPPPAETVRRLRALGPPTPRGVCDQVITREQVEELCSSADRVWYVTSFWGSATRPADLWAHVEETFQPFATLSGMMPITILLHEAPLGSPFD